MDINAVSRALHALNMMYQSRYYSLGIADAYKDVGVRKRLVGQFRRYSIRRKVQALIEHDRVLTER